MRYFLKKNGMQIYYVIATMFSFVLFALAYEQESDNLASNTYFIFGQSFLIGTWGPVVFRKIGNMIKK